MGTIFALAFRMVTYPSCILIRSCNFVSNSWNLMKLEPAPVSNIAVTRGFTDVSVHFLIAFCHDVDRQRFIGVGETLPCSLDDVTVGKQRTVSLLGEVGV